MSPKPGSLPMTSRSIRWSVAFLACALAAWALFALVRHEPPTAAARAVQARGDSDAAAAELATPEAAADSGSTRSGAAAAEPARSAIDAPVETPPSAGALHGRVLLDATFADARTFVTLSYRGSLREEAPTAGTTSATAHRERSAAPARERWVSLSASGDGELEEVLRSGPFTGDGFEFAFDALAPGRYEFGLSRADAADVEGVVTALLTPGGGFFALEDVLVTAGEPTRDPRLDPLDLRGRVVRARCVIVDGYGVPRASTECRAIASATSQSSSTTDAHGQVEFVLASSVESIELELERHTTCIVRTPLVFGRSVVVVPDRPTHVLHVDPASLPPSGELSIFVREAEELSGSSPLGRGATWSRFDAAGDAVVAPRRLGPHELEWRLKRPDGTTKSLVDPRQTIDVRAPGEAVLVELVVPGELR